MTEQKHTPEPWKVSDIGVGFEIESSCGMVAQTQAVINDLSHHARKANARRIVAAVNYCQGLDTTCMEIDTATGRTPSVTIPNLTDRVFALEAQLDQLRAALEILLCDCEEAEYMTGREREEYARAALAATE